MAEESKPIQTIVKRKQAYKMLEVYPLHIMHPGIFVPVENLDFSQQFSPSYNKESVYGRMDPIMTYSNTTRSLRINFSCQSHHYFDQTAGVIDNISTINLLTQMLYPAYDDIAGADQALLKAPPFFRIRYGQYFGSYGDDGSSKPGLTGAITSFSHTIGAVAKNAAYGLTSEGKHLVLPREIKVTLSFEVIHDEQVGWRGAGSESVFSAGGYGKNFPYNTAISTSKSSDSKESAKSPPSSQKPEATDSKSGAGATPVKASTETKDAPKPSEGKGGARAQAAAKKLETIGGLSEGRRAAHVGMGKRPTKFRRRLMPVSELNK